MRIASFNIKRAQRGLEEVARALEALAPDLCGLQEVDRGVRRSGNVDQVAALVKRLGMHAAFGRALSVEGGQYGVAALSRWPVADNWTVPLTSWSEPRALLVAEVAHPSGPVHLAVAHLGLDAGERTRQAEEMLEALAGLPRVVLCADLNEPPDGPAARLIGARLRDGWREAGADEVVTAPPDRPQARIDVVLLGPEWPRSITAWAGAPGPSDHRPVVIELPG